MDAYRAFDVVAERTAAAAGMGPDDEDKIVALGKTPVEFGRLMLASEMEPGELEWVLLSALPMSALSLLANVEATSVAAREDDADEDRQWSSMVSTTALALIQVYSAGVLTGRGRVDVGKGR